MACARQEKMSHDLAGLFSGLTVYVGTADIRPF